MRQQTPESQRFTAQAVPAVDPQHTLARAEQTSTPAQWLAIYQLKSRHITWLNSLR